MKLHVLCLCFVACLSIFMGRSVVDCQTQLYCPRSWRYCICALWHVCRSLWEDLLLIVRHNSTAQEAGGIVFVLCGMFVDIYGKICLMIVRHNSTAHEAGCIVFVPCGMFVDLYGKICC